MCLSYAHAYAYADGAQGHAALCMRQDGAGHKGVFLDHVGSEVLHGFLGFTDVPLLCSCLCIC